MNSTKKVPGAAELPSVAQLEKLAATDVEQWQKLLISGGARLPFGSSESYETHPLRGYFELQRFGSSDRFIHTELFTLCAEKLGLLERGPEGEYVSLRDQLIDELLLYLNPRMGAGLPELTIEWYMGTLFNDIQESVIYAFQDIAEKVACGLPLYRVEPESEGMVLVEDSQQPSAFLIGKRMHRDVSRHISTLPAWVHGHAFKRTDLAAFKLFYGDSASELTDDQISARRIAFRAHVGMGANQPNSTHRPVSSKLMVALQEVRARYYGPNFNLSDQQTWPKQKDVIEWLKGSQGLSDREASAVDIVARPDALRGK